MTEEEKLVICMAAKGREDKGTSQTLEDRGSLVIAAS